MKIAIVTPYKAGMLLEHQEVELSTVELAQCIRSVAEQETEHEVEHILVADGGDTMTAAEAMRAARIPTLKFPRVSSLPVMHNDFGNCARAVGALDAVARGFDAVGFLDADNWLEPSHVQQMAALHLSTGSSICTASRMICRVDGSPMFVDKESDGVGHVDTSCLFVTRGAFFLLPLWAFVPASHAAMGDRVFWYLVRQAGVQRISLEATPPLKPVTVLGCVTRSHSRARTVNYRTRYAVHYRAIGEEPPPGAKENSPLPVGELELQAVKLFVPGVA